MTVAKTACLFCHVPLSKVDYESGSGKVCITIEASRKASSVWKTLLIRQFFMLYHW